MANADTFAPPSIDPADEGSLSGLLRSVLQKSLQTLDDCLPCIVTAVKGRTRVSVQPQVMMGTTDGEKISRAIIPSVPVLNLGAGGFVLSFPINVGDFGWLKASDRDISLFLQGLKEEWPNTRRMHSFADGFFIPDVMRQWTLSGDDAERVVLQSLDGSARVAIGADKIKLAHPTLIELDAPNVTASGNITAAGHVTGAGIVLDTHHHTGVTTGAGVTGGPA